MGIMDVREIDTVDDPSKANRLLQEGWILLSVGVVDPYEQGAYHQYVLGKTQTGE